MKQEYIITEQELIELGIDLGEYMEDGIKSNALVMKALNLGISQIVKMGDNLQFEEDIEAKLDADSRLVKVFKKLQYTIIYNLLFVADNDPLDRNVNDIIANELKLGKINGIQKGWH